MISTRTVGWCICLFYCYSCCLLLLPSNLLACPTKICLLVGILSYYLGLLLSWICLSLSYWAAMMRLQYPRRALWHPACSFCTMRALRYAAFIAFWCVLVLARIDPFSTPISFTTPAIFLFIFHEGYSSSSTLRTISSFWSSVCFTSILVFVRAIFFFSDVWLLGFAFVGLHARASTYLLYLSQLFLVSLIIS